MPQPFLTGEAFSSAGGLFGGLQKMFQGQSNDDKQQQPAKQPAPAVPASKVMFPPYTVVKKGEVYDIRSVFDSPGRYEATVRLAVASHS